MPSFPCLDRFFFLSSDVSYLMSFPLIPQCPEFWSQNKTARDETSDTSFQKSGSRGSSTVSRAGFLTSLLPARVPIVPNSEEDHLPGPSSCCHPFLEICLLLRPRSPQPLWVAPHHPGSPSQSSSISHRHWPCFWSMWAPPTTLPPLVQDPRTWDC